MIPFFIFGLPRSRMAWLANALTYGPSTCMFEGSWGCASLSELDGKLQHTGTSFAGNADAGNALLLEGIVERWPEAPLVVVMRDPREVLASLGRLNVAVDSRRFEDVLEGILNASALKQTLVVPFDRLSEASVGEDVWQHCCPGTPFNADRWAMLSELNVQVIPEIEHRKLYSPA